MSLIVLRRSESCDHAELDTTADLSRLLDSLPSRDRHWNGCTRTWHLTDQALVQLQSWATTERHTIHDARE